MPLIRTAINRFRCIPKPFEFNSSSYYPSSLSLDSTIKHDDDYLTGEFVFKPRLGNHFAWPGKWIVAYLPSIRLKSCYIACACGEIYAPPCAYVYFFGFTIEVTFLRGVYDKLGIEPQVVTALLDGAHSNWLDKVSSARGKKIEDIENKEMGRRRFYNRHTL
ncbi:unnamed protein product [Vicia faba]|uniref:Peptidase S49 domain-containing protein n=1 Tax=Vicia faba TaxID=3906 RepID=A0AAV1AIK8_VICFA|nr:unnamed protein product [Vicia faba]